MFRKILVAHDGSEGAWKAMAVAIVHYAEQEQCDLLVVGRQGHSARWLKHLGSTSSQITFYAPCTVMVVA